MPQFYAEAFSINNLVIEETHMTFVYHFTALDGFTCFHYDPPLSGLDLRGKKYKKTFVECKESLLFLFNCEVEAQGKFTCKSLVKVADEIGLPIKTTCEFLEYHEKLSYGTFERLHMTSTGLREKLKNTNNK
jgi:hypothetical protein